MKLISTNISETSIRMRYADNADPQKATQWIDFQLPLASLIATNAGTTPLLKPNDPEDKELQYLAELHRAALRNARDAISAEIQRIAVLAGRNL